MMGHRRTNLAGIHTQVVPIGCIYTISISVNSCEQNPRILSLVGVYVVPNPSRRPKLGRFDDAVHIDGVSLESTRHHANNAPHSTPER